MISVAAIAIDWFSHPEKVAATRFKIGVGGEEVVSARIPSYIVPALRTLSGVRDAFRTYTLWAINDQLRDRVARSDGDPIGEWIQHRLSLRTENQEAQPTTSVALQDLPHEEALGIMQEAWEHFLGEPLDLGQIQHEYHATDQLPELVVFNPSHAAININQMDPRKVINAREQAQALLRGYVERFHPDLANRIVFQNDRPWDQHDFATRMQILFARDLVRTFDGDRERAQQRIDEFGRHHQKALGAMMLGMSPSELYGMLHPFFFEDPAVLIEPTQKMPATRVMQPLPVARHIAYHQGSPEIEFGIFRKLYTQNATIDDFITWLDRRTLLASQPLDGAALHVLDTIRQSPPQPGKPFISNLYATLNALKQTQPDLTRVLLDYATSDRIKKSSNPEQAWEDLVRELQLARPQEDPTQLRALRKRIAEYKKAAEACRDEINLANLTGNRERLGELVNDEIAERMYYPRTHFENVISVGAGGPVYYVVEGVDSKVYPNLEPVSRERYTNALDAATARQNRLRRSTQAFARLFTPQEPSVSSQPMPEGLVTEVWQGKWVGEIGHLFHQIDVQESSGVQVSVDTLRQQAAALQRDMVDDLGQYAQINVSGNTDLVRVLQQQTFPAIAKAAVETTLREGAAQISKLTAVRQDFLLMLNDINPADAADAEARYNQLLLETCRPKNRH